MEKARIWEKCGGAIVKNNRIAIFEFDFTDRIGAAITENAIINRGAGIVIDADAAHFKTRFILKFDAVRTSREIRADCISTGRNLDAVRIGQGGFF